jgi:hypothetical protein
MFKSRGDKIALGVVRAIHFNTNGARPLIVGPGACGHSRAAGARERVRASDD